MATGAAARRYAQAVFEIAAERSELDKWREELAEIARVLGDPEVHAVLENPRAPYVAKQELLRRALPGLSPLALNLAYLLVRAGRLAVVDQMVETYGQLADAHNGIVHADVVSAIVLSDEYRRCVSEWLQKMSGKKVVLEARTDPSIIGGLVVRVGDRVIDASVGTRLERLKRNLMRAGGRA
ncbi:MAG TPA: ATP synthase F1 subunit delta [Dehalococcoidia bacterium]|nr:ATP synthase F1 subunit delta [Dehalococcoidia bacterium]